MKACPLVQFGPYLHLAIQAVHAFSHADQAEMLSMMLFDPVPIIKSMAVVLDRDAESIGLKFEVDSGGLAAGMSRDVVQCFFDDAINRYLDRSRKAQRRSLYIHRATDACQSFDFGDMSLQRGHNPHGIQDGRVQIVDRAANFSFGFFQVSARGRQFALHGRAQLRPAEHFRGL